MIGHWPPNPEQETQVDEAACLFQAAGKAVHHALNPGEAA